MVTKDGRVFERKGTALYMNGEEEFPNYLGERNITREDWFYDVYDLTADELEEIDEMFMED